MFGLEEDLVIKILGLITGLLGVVTAYLIYKGNRVKQKSGHELDKVVGSVERILKAAQVYGSQQQASSGQDSGISLSSEYDESLEQEKDNPYRKELLKTSPEIEYITANHGKLNVEIPADWADMSSLVFISPPREEEGKGFFRKSNQYHNNVNINFEPIPEEINTPEEYLQEVTSSIKELNELSPEGYKLNFEDVEITQISMGEYVGRCVERKLRIADQWVKQLTAVVFVEGLMIVATTSTSAGAADHEFLMLRKILESIRFE